jgi:hypothetical protein
MHCTTIEGVESGPVFCDWLDVTCHPDDSFIPDVLTLLAEHDAIAKYSDEVSQMFQVGEGTLKLDFRARFHRASASGEVLAVFRSAGLLGRYLSILASVPHTVTRLDAARDFLTDSVPVLRELEALHPDDRVSLSRKALKINRMYSARDSDGAQTGTWYVGHRAEALFTARVYDKKQQLQDKTKFFDSLEPERVRFEFTARKGSGASLKDASEPEKLFYHIGRPFLQKPSGVGDWLPATDFEWTGSPIVTSLPWVAFKRRVEYSAELEHIAMLAASLGEPARAMVLRTFKKLLDSKL